MSDLHLELDSQLGRRAALETALRQAIGSGQLHGDAKLPSSRALASELGVSRATVVAAYEQLVAEGFLVAQHGSATRVNAVHVPTSPSADTNLMGEPPRYDFRPGEPSSDAFPRQLWMRSVRRVMAEAPDDVFGYADPRGRVELRTVLASHLGRTRSVITEPAGVTVVSGVASALGFLGEMFVRGHTGRIAVEDPMLFLHRHILQSVGLTVVPIRVDDQGIVTDDLADVEVDAVLVTPAHQHPVGTTLSATRRNELVAWARETDTWIIEDDYDGEFRYDRRPIGALQALAPDRVIYAGTASKTLAPGLRIAWLVVPPALRQEVLGTIFIRGGVSSIDQLALADFITTGALDRHLRTMRARYRDRREVLADLLDAIDWLEIVDHPAGLHLTARILDPSVSESQLVAEAESQSIGLMGLGVCHLDRANPSHRGLIIGFSRPAEHRFRSGVEALLMLLQSAKPARVGTR